MTVVVRALFCQSPCAAPPHPAPATRPRGADASNLRLLLLPDVPRYFPAVALAHKYALLGLSSHWISLPSLHISIHTSIRPANIICQQTSKSFNPNITSTRDSLSHAEAPSNHGQRGAELGQDQLSDLEVRDFRFAAPIRRYSGTVANTMCSLGISKMLVCRIRNAIA